MRNLHLLFRRKTRKIRIAFMIGIATIGYGWIVGISLFTNGRHDDDDDGYMTSSEQHAQRKLFSLYPPNTFSDSERKNGAIALHILGMIYMFVALAIVCDEFFVPSLGVITNKLKISEDVAGATFMAAGGSAPELFTSLLGVFIAQNNVGIGTIVGSAVFNILFVIGMCAIFSKGVLALTWWPLFRDVTFYSIDLLLLIGFFLDEIIEWWEALILFIMYFAYVTFMKFNHNIEGWVKSKIRKRTGRVDSGQSDGKPERVLSVPILHSGGNRFRHGIVDLMLHHMHHHKDSKPHDKAMHLHAIATLKVVIGTTHTDDGLIDKDNNMINVANGHVSHDVKEVNGHLSPGNDSTTPSTNTETTLLSNDYTNNSRSGFHGNSDGNDNIRIKVTDSSNEGQKDENNEAEPEIPKELEEEEEPLDLSWPKSWRQRITYVFVAPIVFPLWITLPDVRRPEKRKWFMVTFFGSILWIAGYSYLMVWWADTAGTTMGIEEEIMGLTILAAGTSIPDLITSVIVAKKGFGDMAVSSSVGSNIFDITVGLPFPWLLKIASEKGGDVDVTSKGLVCSITLLFLMLIAVIVSIAASKWRMSKKFGIGMLLLYVVFVVLSILLELEIIPCPVKT
ncbi:hypothetical protein FSP39_017749 [Pinctada imbricata]|uniref:Sodium/calcium exchanger membrane region domain-containing protein n=1 Tax=Pinctada imbricata TaxID=66713 RepID=A0AA88YFK7_PINIB|nr:hypothetical protein FSP39_017749 [Pinctada imbricata]